MDPKESKAETQTNAHTPLFAAALFTTAKRWGPSGVHGQTNGRAKRSTDMQPIVLSLENNEISTGATVWTDLKGFVLSEKGQI